MDAIDPARFSDPATDPTGIADDDATDGGMTQEVELVQETHGDPASESASSS